MLEKVKKDFAAALVVVIQFSRALPQNPLPLLYLSGVGCFYYKPLQSNSIKNAGESKSKK